MRIIVTGTPGTGKTMLSFVIADAFGLKYFDGNKIIKKYKLKEGYDRKRKCSIVDIARFARAVLNETKNIDCVIDSHLSHFIPKKHVDLCIVTKANLKNIKKRLKKRGYEKDKIQENLQAEIFEICLLEAKAKKHNVVVAVMNSKKDIKEFIENIISA